MKHWIEIAKWFIQLGSLSQSCRGLTRIRHSIVWMVVSGLIFDAHFCGAEVGANDSLADLQGQMREYERIMQRYFRGDPAKIAQVFQARAQVYDQRASTIQKVLEAERARIDNQEQLLKKMEAQIAQLDAKTRKRPANNPQAAAAYNQAVQARNELVARYNPQREALNAVIKQYNVKVDQNKRQLEAERKNLTGQQQKFAGLTGDYVEWFNSRKDEAFWLDLNRTFVRLIKESKLNLNQSTNSAYVAQMIQKIRQYRKELGALAQAQARTQPLGEVIVSALVDGREECYLVVDTGAATVTLTPEIIQALGWEDHVGVEATLRLAAGFETKGQSILISKLTVLGRQEQQVEGAVIPHSAVGVDGLLGRSFLRRYIVTFDGAKDPKLIPRSGQP